MLAGTLTDTPLAIAGIVPVRVTGPVAAGDLLATSMIPGVARACTDPDACSRGVTFGKALESHVHAGQGMIRVLITLA